MQNYFESSFWIWVWHFLIHFRQNKNSYGLTSFRESNSSDRWFTVLCFRHWIDISVMLLWTLRQWVRYKEGKICSIIVGLEHMKLTSMNFFPGELDQGDCLNVKSVHGHLISFCVEFKDSRRFSDSPCGIFYNLYLHGGGTVTDIKWKQIQWGNTFVVHVVLQIQW